MKINGKFVRAKRAPIPGDLVQIYQWDEGKRRYPRGPKAQQRNQIVTPAIFVRFRSFIHGAIDDWSAVDGIGIDLESPIKGKFHALCGNELKLFHTEDLLSDVMVVSGIKDV